VAQLALALWMLYAVLFPLTLACVIARNKAKQEARRRAVQHGESSDRAIADFWVSTTPVVERFWLPIVAHLQPQYWYFFLIEFFRKVGGPAGIRLACERVYSGIASDCSRATGARPLIKPTPPGLHLAALHPRLPRRRRLQLEAGRHDLSAARGRRHAGPPN